MTFSKIFSLIACALLLPATFARACPVEPPKGMRAVPVSDNIVANGLVMSISQVHSDEPVDTVMTGLAKSWSAAGLAVKRQTIGEWDVLSGKGEACLVTLQLPKNGVATGLLAHSKKSLAATVTAGARGVPLPADAKVNSSVASVDDGRQGLVVSATSPATLSDLNMYFLKTFSENGWTAPRSHTVTNTRTHVRTLFLSAQRSRERVEIVAWDDKAAQIMMTITDAL